MTHADTPLTVLVPDAHLRDLDVERGVAGARLRFLVHDAVDPAEIPAEEWESCDAVLVWHRMRITADLVKRLKRCRHIVRVGVGFDNVDVAACAAHGIPVSNVPNYGTTEVADHALALLLDLTRGIGAYQRRLRGDLAGGFVAENIPVVRRLRGLVFGAVGMGRIGTAVARRAAAFDMKVVYYEPYLPEGHELGLGITRFSSLAAVLAASDIVSLHVPLSAETRGMMGEAQFAAMRPGAIFLNIARGPLVDLSALEAALRSGHLAAAGLDVLPKEPPVPPTPLIEAWQRHEPWIDGRLSLTPHSAFYSEAGYHDMRVFSVEILLDFLFDGRLRNNVNPGWAAHS